MNRRKFLKSASAAAIAPAIAGCSGSDAVPAPDVPRSTFGADSTAEQVTEGIDLTGKTAVVTGCNSGIGFRDYASPRIARGLCDRHRADPGESRWLHVHRCEALQQRYSWNCRTMTRS